MGGGEGKGQGRGGREQIADSRVNSGIRAALPLYVNTCKAVYKFDGKAVAARPVEPVTSP